MMTGVKGEVAEALERGDLDGVLRLWAQVSAGDAGPDDLLQHALVLRSRVRIRDAEALLERLRLHPAATARELLPAAKCLFELGRFPACAGFTRRALEQDPSNAATAAMHASALERSGETEQAARILQEALARQPDHLRSVRLLAHIERLRGDLPAARRRLEEQLGRSMTEEDWRLRHELGAVLDRQGDHAGAMRELTAAKQQLQPQASRHRPVWRAISERQWELTRLLDHARLAGWPGGLRDAEPPLQLCLMAGFPRSGTTLLEQVLTTHPNVIGTDETGILTTQFRDPMVLGAASAAEAVAELDELDPDQLRAGRAEYLRCTAEMTGEDPAGRLLIEKDPLLTADLAIPLRLFPEAKILMPLRDPRDVVISFYFTMVPTAPNSVAAATIEDSCRYYAEVMRHWLFLRERLDPERWMECRYEDLIESPEQETRRIAAFLGLDWSADFLAHHKAAPRAVGTPTYDDVSKPLYTRALGRWRNYEAWLEPHLHHLEPYLEAFGYR